MRLFCHNNRNGVGIKNSFSGCAKANRENNFSVVIQSEIHERVFRVSSRNRSRGFFCLKAGEALFYLEGLYFVLSFCNKKLHGTLNLLYRYYHKQSNFDVANTLSWYLWDNTRQISCGPTILPIPNEGFKWHGVRQTMARKGGVKEGRVERSKTQRESHCVLRRTKQALT